MKHSARSFFYDVSFNDYKPRVNGDIIKHVMKICRPKNKNYETAVQFISDFLKFHSIVYKDYVDDYTKEALLKMHRFYSKKYVEKITRKSINEVLGGESMKYESTIVIHIHKNRK
jgi:hypothetical protein